MSIESLLAYSLFHTDDRPDHPGLTLEEAASFADFICLMVQLRPEDRPRANDLLHHPWLRDFIERVVKKLEGQES